MWVHVFVHMSIPRHSSALKTSSWGRNTVHLACTFWIAWQGSEGKKWYHIPFPLPFSIVKKGRGEMWKKGEVKERKEMRYERKEKWIREFLTEKKRKGMGTPLDVPSQAAKYHVPAENVRAWDRGMLQLVTSTHWAHMLSPHYIIQLKDTAIRSLWTKCMPSAILRHTDRRVRSDRLHWLGRQRRTRMQVSVKLISKISLTSHMQWDIKHTMRRYS